MDQSARAARLGTARFKASAIPVILAGAIFILTMAAFWRVRHFQFIQFDDDINIFLNPHLGRLNGETLRWMLTDTSQMRRYLPAGWAGFALVWGWYGLNPHGYHWACLVLHGVNVLLVTAICLEAIKRFRSTPASGVWPLLSAALAGAWWAWHPLRVEAVAWASGYMYVQTMFFLLSSFYFYATRGDDGWRSRVKLGFSVGFYLLSVATYPITLAYPAALLLWEAAVSQRTRAVEENGPTISRVFQQPARFKTAFFRIVALYGPISAAFGAVTIYAARHARPLWTQAGSLESANFFLRLTRAVYDAGYYLWKLLWPFPSRLVLDSLKTPIWQQNDFWICMLGFALFVYGCFVLRASRHSGFWAVGAAYLALLLPMAGLIENTHFLAGRYTYLISLPWTIALGIGLDACARTRWQAVVLVACLLILGVFFSSSRNRVNGWNSSETFFATAIGEFSFPNYQKEHLYYMWANASGLRGEFNEAREICERGLREFPRSHELKQERSAIDRAARGASDDAKALGLDGPVPRLTQLHEQIAMQKIQARQWADAADHFWAALEIDPDYYPARLTLAEVLTEMGRPSEALACYLRGIANAGGHVSADMRAHLLFMLANASALNGDERLAGIAMEKGLELRRQTSR